MPNFNEWRGMAFCEACGNPFSAYQRRNGPRRFCNYECLSDWYSAKFEGIDHLLTAAYESGRSTQEIAKQFNLSYTQVRLRLIKLGVTMRSRDDGLKLARHRISATQKGSKRKPLTLEQRAKLSKAHQGKGKGYTVKPSGYVEFTSGPNKYRSVHDVIVEERIGRRLLPNEVVHHDDGDRGNNDPSNLTLLTRGEHSRLHARQRSRRTHCIHGHEFTSTNTHINDQGHQVCRHCWRDRAKRKWQARLAVKLQGQAHLLLPSCLTTQPQPNL